MAKKTSRSIATSIATSLFAAGMTPIERLNAMYADMIASTDQAQVERARAIHARLMNMGYRYEREANPPKFVRFFRREHTTWITHNAPPVKPQQLTREQWKKARHISRLNGMEPEDRRAMRRGDDKLAVAVAIQCHRHHRPLTGPLELDIEDVVQYGKSTVAMLNKKRPFVPGQKYTTPKRATVQTPGVWYRYHPVPHFVFLPAHNKNLIKIERDSDLGHQLIALAVQEELTK